MRIVLVEPAECRDLRRGYFNRRRQHRPAHTFNARRSGERSHVLVVAMVSGEQMRHVEPGIERVPLAAGFRHAVEHRRQRCIGGRSPAEALVWLYQGALSRPVQERMTFEGSGWSKSAFANSSSKQRRYKLTRWRGSINWRQAPLSSPGCTSCRVRDSTERQHSVSQVSFLYGNISFPVRYPDAQYATNQRAKEIRPKGTCL